jgi:hypothetical protein
VIDGDLVALNTEGKPDFTLMQSYKSTEFLVYFVFIHQLQNRHYDQGGRGTAGAIRRFSGTDCSR